MGFGRIRQGDLYNALNLFSLLGFPYQRPTHPALPSAPIAPPVTAPSENIQGRSWVMQATPQGMMEMPVQHQVFPTPVQPSIPVTPPPVSIPTAPVQRQVFPTPVQPAVPTPPTSPAAALSSLLQGVGATQPLAQGLLTAIGQQLDLRPKPLARLSSLEPAGAQKHKRRR